MIEVLVAALAGIVALLALGNAYFTSRHAKEIARVLAQCDESRKATQRAADKVMDRWMAVTTPNNFVTMRQHSGVVEGVQAAIKPHYLDEKKIAEELDARRLAEEQATITMQNVRAAMNGDLAHREAKRPMLTAMDADQGAP